MTSQFDSEAIDLAYLADEEALRKAALKLWVDWGIDIDFQADIIAKRIDDHEAEEATADA